MNKLEFLKTYLDSWNPRLRCSFDYATFLANEEIAISMREATPEESLSFFVLRYSLYGNLDTRAIEDIFVDPDSALITLQEAAADVQKWDLQRDELITASELWPIPIATDEDCGRSLVLDSNHTLSNLIVNLAGASRTALPLVEVSGRDMEQVFGDFKVLKRQLARL